MELSDKSYDGEDEGDRLVGGLGQLVDGQKGVDNFRSDIHGFGKGEFYFLIQESFTKGFRWFPFGLVFLIFRNPIVNDHF